AELGGRIAQYVTVAKPPDKPHQWPPAVSPVSPSSVRYCMAAFGTTTHSPLTSICTFDRSRAYDPDADCWLLLRHPFRPAAMRGGRAASCLPLVLPARS